MGEPLCPAVDIIEWMSKCYIVACIVRKCVYVCLLNIHYFDYLSFIIDMHIIKIWNRGICFTHVNHIIHEPNLT